MMDFLIWLWSKVSGNGDDPVDDPSFGPYADPGG